MSKKATPRIGVLLSGSGVYDGSEIHEAVLTLLALEQRGVETVCMAPDVPQKHVVDHRSGQEMAGESRNVLTESARIARGKVIPLSEVNDEDIDGLAMPGGFGAAKNLCTWAFDGPEGTVLPEVQALIRALIKAEKPIAALCVAPTVVALSLKGTGISPLLTVGTDAAPSPYDIKATTEALAATGAKTAYCGTGELVFDDVYSIISSPCYMMEASVAEVNEGVTKTIAKLVEVTALSMESKGKPAT